MSRLIYYEPSELLYVAYGKSNLSEKGYSILSGSLWYIIWRNLDVQAVYESQHEILVQKCGMCDQHTHNLIRAFACHLNILLLLSY